jgi:hypothetical protein
MRSRVVAAGGAAPLTMPTVPTTAIAARWQPDFSTVTRSGNIVTTASDLVGSFNLAEAAAGIGAIEMVETEPTSPMFGRKFWRFNGAQAMEWATLSLSTANSSIWMVCRSHRCFAGTLLSLGPNGSNTNGGTISVSTSGGLAPWIRNANISANTGTTNRERLLFGCQPQVIGVVSGAGAASTRLYMNQHSVTVAGPTAGTWAGGQIGRYARTNSDFCEMDVFDVIIYNARQSNTDADATAAALQTGYGIPTITNSLVLEGDSITAGFGPVLSSESPSRFVRPPAGWRVLACPSSGNTTANLYGRQVLANSLHSAAAMLGGPLSGLNHLVFQIGANDIGLGTSYTGSISGTTLTVTAVTANNTLGIGDAITTSGVAPGTTIISQLTGTPGGIGTYEVSVSQTVTSRALNGGRTAANTYNLAGANNSICALIGNAVNGYRLNYDKIAACINIAQGNAGNQVTTESLRTLMRNIAQFRIDTGCTTNLQIIDLPEITVGSLANVKPFSTAALAVANNAGSTPTTAIYQTDTLHPTGTNPANKPGNRYMVQGGAWDGGTGDGYEAAFTL